LDVQFNRAGIHLPQLGLWLDARRRIRGNDRVFVSHAHADHIGAHDKVLLTEATSLFMRTRLPGKRHEQILNFGARTEFRFEAETFHLTALPAGHILGSAMAFIEWRDETLLYTGDFKLRPSLAAVITGWAMDSSCRYRSGTDAAFPLSDHADYDGLLELVRLVQPKKVFTVHGFAREFALTLRAQSVDAIAPGWHEQLALL
jgi:Cft2 family RNA processing exonuclease